MSYLALNEEQAKEQAKFGPGDLVKKPKERQEMTVVSHGGGTVRVQWEDNGTTREANYSACQLELVRKAPEA